MGRTAKTSPFYSTPRELRKRKPLEVTISDESRQMLEAIAAEDGVSKSQAVEDAIKAYKISRSQKST